MRCRSSRYWLWGLVVVCVAMSGDLARGAATTRPNVVLIIADDLNNHLGCYGDPLVKTPNIDRLASRGVRFDRAYCQYPVCNPSRTSFLSGMRPETTGIRSQPQMLRRDAMPEAVYLPEHFRASGYFTAGIGKVEHGGHYEIKWDVIDDFKGRGDGEMVEGAPAAPAATTRPRRRAQQQQRRRATGPDALPYTIERQTEENDPENVDDSIAKKVVGLLEERKKDGKPFFIVAGFHKPHVPHVAPRRFFDMYPLNQVKVTDVPAFDEKDIPAAARANKRNYQPDMTERQRREIIRAYLACTSYMDEKVGEVTGAMEQLGLLENTVIVFLGDHGWHFGEHHLWAKASLFEESARAPLIVVAPGLKSDASCGRVVEFLDLYPTLAELCGLGAPPQSQGKSFVPLLRDPAQPWDKAAYTCVGAGPAGRSVRTERYRYTEWNGGGIELYDHEADPHELTNLADNPAHAQAAAEMKRLLEQIKPAPTTAQVSRGQ